MRSNRSQSSGKRQLLLYLQCRQGQGTARRGEDEGTDDAKCTRYTSGGIPSSDDTTTPDYHAVWNVVPTSPFHTSTVNGRTNDAYARERDAEGRRQDRPRCDRV